MVAVNQHQQTAPLALRDSAVVGFVLTIAMLIIGGALGYRNAGRLASHNELVSRSHEVVVALEKLRGTITDAETGQRGFLLSEDEKYLRPYTEAAGRIDTQLARLSTLTEVVPPQHARLQALEEKIDLRMEELRRTVSLMQAGNRAAALDILHSDTGRRLSESVQQDIQTMQEVAEDILRERTAQAERSFQFTVASIIWTVVVGVLLVVLVFALSRRYAVQREQAAKVLADQKELLRVTLASIGDAVITTNREGQVTFLNPMAEWLTGWTQEEATGRPLTEVFRIVNEVSREEVANPALRALRDGTVKGLGNHTILIARDGTERPIDDSAAPIRDQDGNVPGAVLVFRDITERRQAEQELRESEAKFTQLADAIPQLAWMAHPDGHIDWYNSRWYEYTGTTFEQMEGWGWELVHDPEVLPEVLEKWKASIASGEPFDMVFPLKGADGVFRPFLTRIMPFHDQNGKLVRWFGTNTDISELNEAQEELRRIAAELSEADRRKTEFLAMLGHELRNPLAPIRTGLEVMRRIQDDPQQIEEVRTMMERQTQQLVRLIDDLLDVSRITHGKLELRRGCVELSHILESAIEATVPLIEERQHELTVDLAPQPIYLHADPHRLAQVFSNLLSNAARYTPPGGQIELVAEQDGSDVVISVKDNGVGIEPEMRDQIFEMFTQVDRTSEETDAGLGIGLTLVQKLVQMHGGSIDVRSAGLDGGSEFRVVLPIETGRQSGRDGRPDSGTERTPEAGRRVLVVDDNLAAARMLSLIVQMLGHEVRTASDGQMAIEVAEEFRPEVILMDIGMPKMNGYEAGRHIRRQPWGRTILMVALTGWGQEDDKQRTKDAGFDQHLVKPAEPAELERLLSSPIGST